MGGLIWIISAVVTGCLSIYCWTDLRAVNPKWARLLLIAGAGAAAGIGLTSCLFFLAGPLLKIPAAAPVLELAILAWAGYQSLRLRSQPEPSPEARSPLSLLLIAGLVVIVGVGIAAFSTAWDFNPQGNWDAWAIWNLRARFLASGSELAARAWSPALGASTHAEYPLLLSSFVARCWYLSQSSSSAVPAATAFVFFLSLIAVVTGGITALRGPVLGLLAGLTLATTPSLLREVPAQYADVPLACYMAAALILVLIDRPLLAGIFAAFAAWTKDEGVLFLVVFLAAIAIVRRNALRTAVAGALPVLLLNAGFKLFLARGNSSLLSASLPGAVHRIFDPSRFATVLSAFGREFVHMSIGWYHPILPLIVLAVALGPDWNKHRREIFLCAAVFLGLLLGDFGVYLVTSNDLAWQLQTSLNRILLQLWPLLVLVVLLCLRTTVEFAAAPSPAAPRARKATKKKR